MNLTYLNDYIVPIASFGRDVIEESIGLFAQHKINIDQDRLREAIENDVTQLWAHRLEKTFILELHQSKYAGLLKGKTSKQRYKFFVNAMSQKNNRDYFLSRYPVIKDKLAIFHKAYLDYIDELCQRLSADGNEFGNKFNISCTTQKLTSIRFAGDPHNNFRRVAILFFSKHKQKETTLVYKPRSIVNEQFFNEIIGFFNKGMGKKLKPYVCLPKVGYGWCGFITGQACKSKKELHDYYYRFGVLCLIVYAFKISDMHYENLIASGAHPVVIDLECLGFEPAILSGEKLHDHHNVLYSGMLPHYVFERAGGMDISAFGGGGTECETPSEHSYVANIGRDDMHISRKSSFFRLQPNRPVWNKKPANPSLYTQDIRRGFEQAYSFLLKNKKQAISIIKIWADKLQVRMVFRATALYSKLLSESYHPFLFRKQSEYDQHIHWLEQTDFGVNFPLKLKKTLRDSELKQIKQDDIPLFYFKGKSLHDGLGKQITSASHVSLKSSLLDKINSLDDEDYSLQKNLLEKSLNVRAINHGDFAIPKKNISVKKANLLSERQLYSKAISIMQELLDSRVDQAKWIWPQHKVNPVEDKQYWYLDMSDNSLYTGFMGVLFALVCVCKVDKNPKWLNFLETGFDRCEEVVAELGKFESSHGDHHHTMDLSLFNGLGGMLYVCFHCQGLIENKKVLKLINAILKTIKKNFKDWLKNYPFDIISGIAGLLMVLSLLRQQNISLDYVDGLIKDSRNFLLKHYPKPSKLPAAAKSEKVPTALLGLSHGVSGIAMALYKSSSFFRANEKTENWIKDALRYERKCFDTKYSNWPNLLPAPNKPQKQSEKMQGDWCHGALGVGITRIELKKLGWQDRLIDQEIATSIQTVKKFKPKGTLNLCHGDLGRVDFFLYLYQNGLITEKMFQKRKQKLVEKLSDNKLITEKSPDVFIPGLMTGQAGLIYSILRLLHPDKIPNALAIG